LGRQVTPIQALFALFFAKATSRSAPSTERVGVLFGCQNVAIFARLNQLAGRGLPI